MVLTNNSSELSKIPVSSKIITQKQVTHFEIQRNALKHKINSELMEFDELLSNLIAARTKSQQFIQYAMFFVRLILIY